MSRHRASVRVVSALVATLGSIGGCGEATVSTTDARVGGSAGRAGSAGSSGSSGSAASGGSAGETDGGLMLDLRWSNVGAVDGMTCVSMNEPMDPDVYIWEDNYLCTPEDI